MSFVKNPIILAIVMSAVVFLLLSYFCTTEEEKPDKNDKNDNNSNDKKSKKKKKQDKLSKESIIIISVIAGLGTWYIVSGWMDNNNDESNADIVKLDPNVAKQTGGTLKGQLSDDSTRSYNLIGSGLNIPRSELKLPKVLIDYQ